MKEPQELRSVDELFRNTFNNLPDTHADSGWDTPSEQVWKHVQEQIQTPRAGWGLELMLILVGFAGFLALGLFLTFTPFAKVEEKTVVPTVTPITTPTTPAPITAPEMVESAVSTAATTEPKQVSVPTLRRSVGEKNRATPAAESPEKVNSSLENPRLSGAAPLPGSKSGPIRNTREELKAEHARQVELCWKTPLKLLPVPRNKKAID
jgi:hypothetical protein